MKFLIFNLVVGSALVYLVTGGNFSQMPSSSEAVNRVSAAGKIAVDHSRDITDKVISEIRQSSNLANTSDKNAATKAIPKSNTTIKTTTSDHRNKVAASNSFKNDHLQQTVLQPPPAPVLVKKNKLAPEVVKDLTNLPKVSAPAVLRRRAEVLARGSIKNTTSSPRYMSMHDRQQELHALSEEMELMFARTMTR